MYFLQKKNINFFDFIFVMKTALLRTNVYYECNCIHKTIKNS